MESYFFSFQKYDMKMWNILRPHLRNGMDWQDIFTGYNLFKGKQNKKENPKITPLIEKSICENLSLDSGV